MPLPSASDPNNGLAAMAMQFGPLVRSLTQKIAPFIDQPIIRFPFNMPLAQSQTIPAGANNVPLSTGQDFSYSLEWPFEVRKVRFSQDPAHTTRDWRITIQDLVFNQTMFKAAAMVATLIDANTQAWELDFPWVVRPKGGGLVLSVNNLDLVNPIIVDINFQGYLLIPRT